MNDIDKRDSQDYVVDIRRHLGVLGKQKAFIIVFCLAAILSAVALTYVMSEKYQAATTIFYRPLEVSLLRQKEIESFGAPTPSTPFGAIRQTLRDAIKNEAILRRVVDELDLDKEGPPPTYGAWYLRLFHGTKNFFRSRLTWGWMLLKYGRVIEEDPTVTAIKELRANIDILSTKDSYIYILKVKDKYPVRAARIVDVSAQYMVEWLSSHHESSAMARLQQLDKQLAGKEMELAALERERKTLLEENKLVSISEETTKGLANLYELQLEEVRLNGKIRKTRREVAEYEKVTQEEPDDYVQREDIKSARSAKLFQEIDLKALTEQRDHISDSIKELSARLDLLPSLQEKLDILDVKIRSGIREHEHLKDFHTEVAAQVAASQSEAKILHAATVPAAPVQPIKAYHVGLAALLAVLFSVGSVFVLDFLGIGLSETRNLKRGNSDESHEHPEVSFRLREVAAALEQCARRLGAEGGSVFVRSSARRELGTRDSLVLAESLDPGHAPSVIPFPPPRGSVFERVVSTGVPLLVDDVEEECDLVSSGWTGYKDGSVLAFPLENKKGETVGVVALHNKTSGPFVARDRDLGFKLLSTHLAPVIAGGDWSKGATHWRRRSTHYLIVALSGVTLAVIVAYLLKKMGY
jgi:uncharacterized protein involved in exopolysaccharide biosynthesis